MLKCDLCPKQGLWMHVIKQGNIMCNTCYAEYKGWIARPVVTAPRVDPALRLLASVFPDGLPN